MRVVWRRNACGVGLGLLAAAGGCGLLGGYDFGDYTLGKLDGGASSAASTSSAASSSSAGSGSGGSSSSSTAASASTSSGAGGGGPACKSSAACDGGVCDAKGACRAAIAWLTPLAVSPGQGVPGVGPIFVAADPNGAVALAGGFAGTLHIGGKVAGASNPTSSPFVAALAPNGSASWLHTLVNGPGAASVTSVAISPDGSGLVVIGGSYGGTLALDGTALLVANGGDIELFLAAYDGTGTLVWYESFDAPGIMNGNGLQVAFGPNGDLYAAGGFGGQLMVDGGSTTAGIGAQNMLVMKLAGADGTVESFAGYTNLSSQTIRALAVDPASGDLAVMGAFWGALSLGCTNLPEWSPSESDPAVFVAVLDGDTNCKRAGVYGAGSLYDNDYSIAFGKSGAVVVAGDFDAGGLSFVGSNLQSAGGEDVFVAQFDGTDPSSPPVALWQQHFGSPKDDEATGVAGDPQNGGSVVVGKYGADIAFGSFMLPLASASGGSNGFVVRLDDSGNVVWARALQADDAQALSVAVVPGTGAVIVAGNFQGTLGFFPPAGPDAGPTSAKLSGFVVKLAP